MLDDDARIKREARRTVCAALLRQLPRNPTESELKAAIELVLESLPRHVAVALLFDWGERTGCYYLMRRKHGNWTRPMLREEIEKMWRMAIER